MICPTLSNSGKVPSVNDRLANLQTSGAKMSLQSLISDIGIKSSGDVFSGQSLITFKVLLSVTRLIWLKSGGTCVGIVSVLPE